MLRAQNFGANVANLALPLQDLPSEIKCKKAALKHQQTEFLPCTAHGCDRKKCNRGEKRNAKIIDDSPTMEML